MDTIDIKKREWWSERKFRFTKAMILTSVTSCTVILIFEYFLIRPHVDDFNWSPLEVASLTISYFVMVVIAHLFYNLGYQLDKNFNKLDNDKYRLVVYRLICWFFVALLSIFPVGTVIGYFTVYAK